MRFPRLIRFGAVIVMAGCVTALTATRADAAAMLRLTQGVNQVTITDNLAGDSNPAVGAVTWIGSLGVFACQRQHRRQQADFHRRPAHGPELRERQLVPLARWSSSSRTPTGLGWGVPR